MTHRLQSFSTHRPHSASGQAANGHRTQSTTQSISSILRSLYAAQPADISERAAEFMRSPKNVPVEIAAFNALLQSQTAEKAEIIFLFETLSHSLRRPADFSQFVSVVLQYVDSHLIYKNSILLLRMIRSLVATKFYVPVVYYLARIIEEAIGAGPGLVSRRKPYDYDDIRLSSDDLKTEELQLFVVREGLGLVDRQCRALWNSIGFPEYAFTVCNELRTRCKTGVFKEMVGNMIKSLMDRKAYVEEERAKLGKGGMLTAEEVREFETGLAGAE